jgi:hypothetical protein
MRSQGFNLLEFVEKRFVTDLQFTRCPLAIPFGALQGLKNEFSLGLSRSRSGRHL